ncbi:pentapeptide repeat-containing protein [Microbacterium deminutum]|uniref:pentapeptide repeat-containing protein n=1 Tax=Microbacterium deminutum TaxID=344164 RepID=UPI0031D283B8
MYLPDWLVTESVSANPAPSPTDLTTGERVSAVTAARTAVLFAAGGLLAVLTLYLTAARDAAAADKLDLDRDANRTDRYADAAKMLGDKSASSRLAGIYALERLAKESHADWQTIIDVVSGFVRDRAPQIEGPAKGRPPMRPTADVDAAIRALARLTNNRSSQHAIWLRDRMLAYSSLSGARLGNANLHNADLTEAYLIKVDFGNSEIGAAVFTDANLKGADLRGVRHCKQEQFYDVNVFDSDTKWPPEFSVADIDAAVAARKRALETQPTQVSPSAINHAPK